MPKIQLILILTLISYSHSLKELLKCSEALGMQSGAIGDSQLSASSSYDLELLGPQHGRIRTERQGGAWCPQYQVDAHSYEYLQIDLDTIHVITGIETQGRFGNGHGTEFAEYYRIEYTRDRRPSPLDNHTITWLPYSNRAGEQTFKGNENAFGAEMRRLNKALIARQVRIIPLSTESKTVCMRVELYGCKSQDHLISYEVRQGDHVRKNGFNFADKTYDGRLVESGGEKGPKFLLNGLGLLTDGEFGTIDDLSAKQERYGHKGYDWLGWRNSTINTHEITLNRAVLETLSPKERHKLALIGDSLTRGEPLKILFNFDGLRNFTLCTLFFNNNPNFKIELFSQIRMKFSVDEGLTFSDELRFEQNRDTDMVMPRPILIPMLNKVANTILIEMFFYSRLLLLSEVSFDSTPAALADNNTPKIVSKLVSKGPKDVSEAPSLVSERDIEARFTSLIILLCVLLGVLLMLFVLVVIVLLNRSRKSANRKKRDPMMASMSFGQFLAMQLKALLCCGGSSGETVDAEITPNSVVKSGADDDAYLYPSSSTNMGTLAHHQQPLIIHNHADQMHYASTDVNSFNGSSSASSTHQLLKVAVPSISNASGAACGSNSNNTNLYYTIKPQQYHAKIGMNVGMGVKLVNDYQRVTAATLMRPSQHYAAFANHTLQAHGHNYATLQHPNCVANNWVNKIDANSLSFLSKIGESTVSNFYVGQMSSMDVLSGQFGQKQVLIKVLKNEHDKAIKCGFDNDIDLSVVNKSVYESINSSGLSSAKLIRCLGFADSPYCYILEPFTNLYEYLTASQNDSKLTQTALINIAKQAANAMTYLESTGHVHKDLSCKNCLVSVNAVTGELSVKICDLARYMYAYRDDYCVLLTNTHQSIRLRCSAFESICTGQFSVKSDVWSFGVMLFEMMSACRVLPYADLNDEALIQLFNKSMASGESLSALTPIIANCLMKGVGESLSASYSKEILELMGQCCSVEESARPSFNDIHVFLSFKLNSGQQMQIQSQQQQQQQPQVNTNEIQDDAV